MENRQIWRKRILGNFNFGLESDLIFEISSEPAIETMNISSNISVDLFISLTTGSSTVAALCPGLTTSFEVGYWFELVEDLV